MLTDEIYQRIVGQIEATNPNVFVLDVQLKQGSRNVLSVKLDTDKGITMDECAVLTRALGPWMDEVGFFEFDYGIELSSPGVGAPLLFHRQYLKNIGRDLRVINQAGEETEGRLMVVEEKTITINPYKSSKNLKKGQKPRLADEQVTISFEDIKTSKVII